MATSIGSELEHGNLTIPEPPDELTQERDNCWEYLDGQWIEKEDMGRFDHSTACLAIYELLKPFKQKCGGQTRTEWSMWTGKHKPQPDVLLTHPDHTVYDGYAVSPPLLAVEVRSDKQTLKYLEGKCRRYYHSFGVPYCWLIDTEHRKGYEFNRGDAGRREVEILTAGEIQIPVLAIFETMQNL